MRRNLEPNPASVEHLFLQVADSEILFFFGENASVKRRNNAALSNCTLGIIKPHAIAQGDCLRSQQSRGARTLLPQSQSCINLQWSPLPPNVTMKPKPRRENQP